MGRKVDGPRLWTASPKQAKDLDFVQWQWGSIRGGGSKAGCGLIELRGTLAVRRWARGAVLAGEPDPQDRTRLDGATVDEATCRLLKVLAAPSGLTFPGLWEFLQDLYVAAAGQYIHFRDLPASCLELRRQKAAQGEVVEALPWL